MAERVPDEHVDPAEFPPPGPVGQRCGRCRQPGLVLEHRVEYLDPPEGGWPPGVDAARLALACRGCGSDYLTRSTELVADMGAQAEFAAREVPWLVCEDCQRGAGGRLWPWLVCSVCGAEERGEYYAR